VASGEKTDLIVNMSLLPSGIEPVKSTIPLMLYPNPSRGYLNVVLPDLASGRMNVRIINQSGMLVSDYNSDVVQGIPIAIEIRSLSPGTYTVEFSSIVAGTSYHGRFVVIK